MMNENELDELPFLDIQFKDCTPKPGIRIPEHVELLPDGYCGGVMTRYGFAFADSNPESRYISGVDEE